MLQARTIASAILISCLTLFSATLLAAGTTNHNTGLVTSIENFFRTSPPGTDCHCVVSINSESSCSLSGGSATAFATGGSYPYTYQWSTGATSQTINNLSSGTYYVTVTDKYGCQGTQTTTINNVSFVLSATGGGTICEGGSTQLNASGADLYSWTPTTGLSDASIANPVASPSVTTTYTVKGAVPSGELVTNGNFSSGNTGFTSEYSYNSDLYPEGRYYVGRDASDYHGNFFGTGHGGSGKFMIINGATVAGVEVWSQTVNVTPNTTYYFSTWITALNGLVSADLAFSINGTLLGPVINSPSNHGSWIQFYAVWNSGSATSADIAIVNQNTIANGNDFGLDDISFTTVCEKTKQVTVTVKPAPNADAGADKTVCYGSATTLTATGGVSYQWSNGATTATTTVYPTSQTTYTVTVTGSNGCTATDQVEVDVTTTCPNWEFDCANRVVEVVGKGTNGTSPTTLNFTDVSTIDSIVVEAIAKNSTLPTSATFVTSTQNITNTNGLGVIYTNGSQRIFRQKINPTSSVTVSTNQPGTTWSIVAYVFRSGGTNSSGGSGFYTNAYIYKRNHTYNLTVPATPVAKDITVTIPITEMTNDSRVANITATAGSVTASTSINTYSPSLGNALNIVTLTLNNVPANETNVSVLVSSPSSGGDSFLSGVSVSTQNCCSPMSSMITTTDVACKADTVEYCTLTLATSQHGLWLDDIPNDPSKYYKIVGGSMTATKYSDGRLHIAGTFENVNDANRKWTLDVMYHNKMDWTQWSATGGSWKGNASNVGTNYEDWDYYIMDDTYQNKLTGSGAYAGKTLNLTHKPASYYYAFQVGLGANDQTADWGMSGWFDHTGSYTGNGDINFDAICDSSNVTTSATCNGTADLTVTGGAAPYTYQWSNGATSQDVSGLCAGTYTVTITDAYGCSATKSATVSESNNPTLTVDVTSTPVTCNPDTVTICDLSNATSQHGVWLNSIPGDPSEYYLTTNAKTVAYSNGTLHLTGTVQNVNDASRKWEIDVWYTNKKNWAQWSAGGGGWKGDAGIVGNNFQDWDYYIMDTSKNNQLIGLDHFAGKVLSLTHKPANHYYGFQVGLAANDKTGDYGMSGWFDFTGYCSGTGDFNFDAACVDSVMNHSVCNGTATASASGGTAPYTYTWSHLPGGGTSILFDEDFSSYSDGSNTSSDWSVSGSTSGYFAVYGNKFKASNTGNEMVWTSSVINISGYSSIDVSMDLSSAGGEMEDVDYLNVYYKLDGGSLVAFPVNGLNVNDISNLTASVSGLTGSTLQIVVKAKNTTVEEKYYFDNVLVQATNPATSTPSLTDLCPGTYGLTVTDAYGCFVTDTVVIDTVPCCTNPTLTTSVTDEDCYGACTGEINLTVNGYGAYTYLWSNGATTEDITGLCKGTYTVTVTDQYGCTRTTSATVDGPSTGLTANATGTPVSCFGGTNGTATITATGGTAPYTYSWNTTPTRTTASITGLGARAYSVTVTDANGCTAVATTTVTQPGPLTLGAQPTPVDCNGGNDGAIDLTVTGGTSPFTYSWSNGATTEDITGLTAGSYTVTVVDANNCQATLSVTVLQPQQLTVSALATPVTCDSVTDGTVTLTVNGGTSPFTYSWNNGATTKDLSGLNNGTYNVTVTDANGCTGTASATVNDNVPIVVTCNSTDVSTQGGTDGTVSVTVTGGVTPYSFLWSTGATTQTLNNQPAGVYSVTVTDANGCPVMYECCVKQPSICEGFRTQTQGGWGARPNGGNPAVYLYANFAGAFPGGLTVGCATGYELNLTSEQAVTDFLPSGSTPRALTSNLTNPGGSYSNVLAGQVVALTLSIGFDNYDANFGPSTTALQDLVIIGGPFNNWTVAQVLAEANKALGGCGSTYSFSQLNNAISSINENYVDGNSTGNYLNCGLELTDITVDVKCYGENTGSVDLTVSGGVLPYTYSWSNGATTQDLVNVPAGTYSVTVTDANGLPGYLTTTVDQPTDLVLSVTTVDNTCNGACTGFADLTVSGGVAPYTYAWSNGATTQDVSNLCTGSYTVTVTDANNCSETKNITITQPSSLVASIVKGDIDCNGADNGTADLTVSGGVAPYTYNWSNGATTEDLSNLAPGTYTVTVTDANNCNTTASTTIQQPPMLTANATSTPVSCFGGTNGTATVTATGGTAPYTYSWNTTPARTTASITGLGARAYSVTVTDANGCTAVATTTVTQPGPLTLGAQPTPVDCNGGNDGAIDLTVTGGTSPFTYSWSNGATTEDISGLTAGSYTVTVVDANNCQATLSVTVLQPQPLSASATATDVTCYDESNGSVDLSVTGGTSPFTYNWSNGASTEDLNGLSAGTYSVTVTDVNGCTASASATVTQPDSLALISDVDHVSCNGVNDGSIDLSVNGGTSPFTYNWSNGATSQDLNGLTSGIYIVTVTDANGCVAIDTAGIIEQDTIEITIDTITNVSCNGGNDGEVTITITGGTPSCTPSIPTPTANCSGGTPISGNQSLNISSGKYVVEAGATWTGSINMSGGQLVICGTAQPSNFSTTGGEIIVLGTLQTNVINLQPAVTIKNYGTMQIATNITGGGKLYNYADLMVSGDLDINASNGIFENYSIARISASLNNSGYSANYGTLYISNSLRNNGGADFDNYCGIYISANFINNSTFQNYGSISAAAYTYLNGGSTLTMGSGSKFCTGNLRHNAALVGPTTGCASFTVSDHTIINSGAVTSNNLSLCDANGIETNNGSFTNGAGANCTCTANGVGNGSYTITWSNGDTGETADTLSAGTYTVTVTDANGCSATETVVITEPDPLVLNITKQDVACNGGNDGTADLTVTGGTTPYTYAWSNGATTEDLSGLSAGTYTVTVTDANNCTATENVTIGQNANLSLTLTPTSVVCNGESNGSIDLTVSGGTGNYTYAWSNGATTEDISGLAAGTYTVTVTDGNGCYTSETATVTEPNTLTASASSTPVSCFGGTDGTASVTANGGTAPYTYSWSTTPARTTANITGLGARAYSVTVTDANGCTAVATTTVTQPGPLTLGAQPTPVDCNGGNDGAIDLTVTGGTSPFTYSWSNGASTEDITGLTAGSYTVTVVDANNCQATLSVTVLEPQPLTASATATNASCYGYNNGTVDLSVTGGTSPFTYAWSNSATTEDLSGVGAGTYNVTVTDVNGCTATASATVTQPDTLTASITKTDITCYGDADGSANLTVAGGTTPYTYAWNNGATTEDLSNLAPGTYGVTVTDANNCSATGSVVVTQPDTLTTSITKTDISCGGGNGPCRVFKFGGAGTHAFWLPTLPNIGENFVFGPMGGVFEELPGGKAHIYGVIYHEADTNYSWTVDIWFSDKMDWAAWSALGRGYKDEANVAGNNYLNWDYYIFDTTRVSALIGRNIYAGEVVPLTHLPANYQFGLQVGEAANSKTTGPGMATWFTLGGNYSGQGDLNLNLVCGSSSCDGSADLTVAGGTAPFTYNWSNGETTEDLSMLCEGTYNVTVTDANGCTALDTVTIISAPDLQVSATGTNVSCSANCDGTASATVSGGTPPYVYNWSNGESTANISNLCGGTYYVTVTDDKGCYGVDSVVINANPLLVATLTPTAVGCKGEATGSITTSVNGGVAPYTYLWSNSATTADISNLTAGTYTLIVSDANGCADTVSATVTEPADSLAATATSTPVSCFGGTDGTAGVTATGGTAPYTYVWSTTPARTTANITGLRAGSYNVTVTDANGCSTVATTTVTQPGPLTLGAQPTPVNCNGGADGAIDLTVSGGTPGFTYIWSNGATTQDISGLTAGSYTVTTTDANGCVATLSVSVLEPQPLTASTVVTDVLCNNANNGAIDLSITGGTSPFTYSWSNGATTEDISGVGADVYSVTVTDVNGCTATATDTVSEPTKLTATITTTDVTCNGLNDGTATATVSGGTPPYTYGWSGRPDTTATITNLAPGAFPVTITDANGCIVGRVVRIEEPATLTTVTTSTDVSCYGAADGTANTTASGGTPPYTYQWSTNPVSTDAAVSGLSAGTFIVTVTDDNGCTVQDTVTVTQPDTLTASLTKFDVACNGGNDGSIDLTVAGGTSPYTYLWSNAATTEDLSNLVAGTYGVTVTDANGCTATGSVLVEELPGLSLQLNPTNVSCNGLSDGAIDLSASGGTNTYTYIWSNGATTEDISGLSAGRYHVTVTDGNGCVGIDSVDVTEPATLTATATSTPVSCFGGTDGTAGVTATGGTAPYTYVWSTTPARTTANITGLRAGPYSVTITDANGCTTVATTTVTQPGPLTLGAQPTPVNCNGGADGAIDLTVSGGTPGFTYVWSNGDTTQDITGLTAGSYTVTTTDANGCVATLSVSVLEPMPLTASATATDATCYGAANGSVDLSVVGGTSPFTYNWSNSAATEDLSGVGAGTYNVTVTDVNGCTATASATVGQPDTLTVSLNGSDVRCYGDANGSALSTVAGGTAPYTYLWSTGSISPNLINLSAGSYSVTVTDANNCTATASVNISENDSLTVSISTVDLTCYGDNSGSIDITVTGGTNTYSFDWSNGATTEDLNNVAAGTYSVTITDANDCSKIVSATITQPDTLTAVVTGSADVTCYGDADGSIDITVAGGTAPYTYSWSNQATTEDLSNLAPGIYTVTVTDANGCIATAVDTITQPEILGTDGAGITDVNCNGESNGAIDIYPIGGTQPYSFAWSNGATTEDLTAVAAGTYSVTITDANGCVAADTFEVEEPAMLNATATSTPVSCFGGTDGTAGVTATGGTAPYTYVWSTTPARTTANITGLRAGAYSVTITDANGCTTVATTTVTQPGPLTLGAQPTPVNCNGGNDGAIDLTVSGGTPGFTFVWGNGATTEDISGLTAGTYGVTVTDANGCVATLNIDVLEPPMMTVSTTHTDVTTNGGADGSIDLSVVGGTTPYNYNWSNGATTQDLSGLTAGVYCVTVTDVNGCTANTCVTITEPACNGFTASATATDVSCNGGSNGTVDVTVTGGVAPFSYSWSNGATTEDLSGLTAGTYIVTITDAVQCVTTATANVGQPAAVSLSTSVTNAGCSGGTGSVDLTVTGGTAPYTYAWSNSAATEDISGLAGGTYNVTVTDANGCTATTSATVSVPAVLSLSATVRNVRCFLGADGFIDLTVTGGTAPYTYLWNTTPTPKTTEDAGSLRPGTYTVTVTDANGCTATLTKTVTQPGPLTLGANYTPVSCNGGNNGAVDLTVNGGVTPYTYIWSNGATTQDITGLTAGLYRVTVTDGNSCVNTLSISVLQPQAINLTATTTPECNGTSDGAVDVTVSGGTTPYSYNWSNGATSQDLTGLTAGAYTVTLTDANGCTASGSFTVTSSSQCQRVAFNIRVLLEGPYMTQSNEMHTKLNTQCNVLPKQQPYNNQVMQYTGSEAVASFDANVVDWVLVSFRSGLNRSSTIYKEAALLLADGQVVKVNGDTAIAFNYNPSDSLYVVVEHRNHLGIMSPVKYCMASATNNCATVDFTKMQSYQTGIPATSGQKLLAPGVYGMYSGDADCNFDINSNDFVKLADDFNVFNIYSPGDFDMNCDCNSNDIPKWAENFNLFSGVR